jgi:hypothetical protein
VVDIYLFLRNPRNESLVTADWLKTRRETAFLRSALPALSDDAPVILVGALTDWVYELKLHLVLATALRLEGWRPVFLIPSRSARRAQRYCRAFGVTDFVYFDEVLLTSAERRTIEARVPEVLERDLTFQQVKELRFEDAWIGPQILATASRTLMRGAPDPRDPEVAAQIRFLLPAVLENAVRGRKVMQEVKPELLLVNEANYTFYGVLVDVAIGSCVDVIHATQPWRDDALMCKRLTKETRRSHPSSVERSTLETLMTHPWTDADEAQLVEQFARRYGGQWFLQGRNQIGVEEMPSSAITETLELDSDKPTVVVFSHVLWDANLFYGEDLFEDYGEWLVETVLAAVRNPSVNWLIKLHPANVWKRSLQGVTGEYSEITLLRERVGPLPDHISVLSPETRVSSLSLYRFADVGITVRGTPGMEMACFGKPVITAGTGRYSGLGFTVDPPSVKHFLAQLARVGTLGPMSPAQITLAKRHAQAVFLLRHWEMSSFYSSFSEEHTTDSVGQNLHLRASSISELEKNGDLKKWAEWAKDRSLLDYLDLDQLPPQSESAPDLLHG